MASLVLGTAQWGLDYGITNADGRLTDEAISSILDTAAAIGISLLDTAAGYGDAEERIAQVGAGFRVATKVRGGTHVSVRDQIAGSLRRLRRASVERCLLHDWPDLTDAQRNAAVEEMDRAREEGLVAAAGVSAYTERDVLNATDHVDSLSVIQVPVNLLDQRLEGSADLADLRRAGWTVQARSVLLQGVLANPDASRFGAHPDVVRARRAAQRSGSVLVESALRYVATRDWLDEIVVGVTSATELGDLATVLAESASAEDVDWSALASADLDLVDPRRWTSA